MIREQKENSVKSIGSLSIYFWNCGAGNTGYKFSIQVPYFRKNLIPAYKKPLFVSVVWTEIT
jgi:hypothetical protein